MNLPSYEDLYSDGTLYVRKSWFHLKLKLYIENSKFTATVFNFGKPFKNYETHLYKNTDYTKSTHFIITFTGTTTTIVFMLLHLKDECIKILNLQVFVHGNLLHIN